MLKRKGKWREYGRHGLIGGKGFLTKREARNVAKKLNELGYRTKIVSDPVLFLPGEKNWYIYTLPYKRYLTLPPKAPIVHRKRVKRQKR